jgi:type IV pilus assembly protein PilX
MLIPRTLSRPRLGSQRRQHGVVLLVALVVLVVMTLAGLALMRSMDTTNLIAGNMAFKQAATHAGDQGIEAAIGWLEANPGLLNADNRQMGYQATTSYNDAYQLGDAFWALYATGPQPSVCYLPLINGNTACSTANTAGLTPAGDTVAYTIQRLCELQQARNGAFCAVVPSIAGNNDGNNQDGSDTLTPPSPAVYYRITVRVTGPRNTVSYVQSVVAVQ